MGFCGAARSLFLLRRGKFIGIGGADAISVRRTVSDYRRHSSSAGAAGLSFPLERAIACCIFCLRTA